MCTGLGRGFDSGSGICVMGYSVACYRCRCRCRCSNRAVHSSSTARVINPGVFKTLSKSSYPITSLSTSRKPGLKHPGGIFLVKGQRAYPWYPFSIAEHQKKDCGPRYHTTRKIHCIRSRYIYSGRDIRLALRYYEILTLPGNAVTNAGRPSPAIGAVRERVDVVAVVVFETALISAQCDRYMAN